MASHSLPAIPVINKASFEDMLAEEANFTPNLQPRHVQFMYTLEGGLTPTLHNVQDEVALPANQLTKATKKRLGSTQPHANLERCGSQILVS